MNEAANIWRVAEDVVRDRGSNAYTYLCERAETAKFIGDEESAISWWDIALAAVEVITEREAPPNQVRNLWSRNGPLPG
jgi:hypothetical protein